MAGDRTGGGAVGSVAGRARTEPTVLARSLTKGYDGHVAVDGLDLELATGEVYGLLGPNGAGKTTTILMLLGLTEPSGGEVRVLGLNPMRSPLEVKRQVGYVPDDVGFYPGMTGRENLRYTARLNGLDAAAAERRIAELLDRVGLCHAADARVDTYSRGMRQRLGIADALVKDPRVLILDEPTVAIDPEGVAEILALIRAVADERGATVLLSSHLLHQVQSVCDRVAIFVDGRKVAEGSVPELASRLGAGPATVEVTVEGEDGTIEATLRDVVGVREVERDPGEPGRWRLAAEGDVRPRIAEALVRRGLALRSLHRREDELDVLYRRYFRDAETRDGREARDGR